MIRIDAQEKQFRELNEEIRVSGETEITIENCMGQRYIGAGMGKKTLQINGVPGNDLGCYLDGGTSENHSRRKGRKSGLECENRSAGKRRIRSV